jgi:hypothetical protein
MTSGPDSPDDTEQLKAQIEQTREHLGRTAEQLVAKVDVKARTQARVTDLTQRAKDATSQVQAQAPMALKLASKHRTKLIIAAGVLVAGALAVTIWSRR